MTLLFILLVQTVLGAVITIIVLLLVAAIIGYFTSWLYAKSIYSPWINGLETDKTELNRQVTNLNDERTKLTAKVEKLKDKIGRIEEESAQKDRVIKKLNKSKK